MCRDVKLKSKHEKDVSNMICPNCEKEHPKSKICPFCKVDSVLYMGIVRLSDKLYNMGLNKLNNGDLTQGIGLLNRSISVNKNNVQARNLLGLALFEIGYVGDALKHWVVSQSLLKENNPATGYVDKVQKNSRALEALNDAMVKYNQALQYIKQKSDDLAIIQLKRAVELNPHLVDALNLLALCHLIQNDKEKAAAAAERVLSIDIQNTIALNYLSIISPSRAKQDTRKHHGRNQGGRRELNTARGSAYKTAAMQVKKPRTFRFDIILALALGAAIAFAVVFILLYPALDRQHESRLQGYRTNLAAAESARLEDSERHSNQIDEIQRQLSEMRDILNASEAEFDLQDRIIRFHHADGLYRDGQLMEAIDRLDNIDTAGFAPDLVERAEAIRESTYPQLSAHFLSEGLTAFDNNDFYKALVDLELATRFMAPDTPRSAAFLFALGSLYAEDEARHAEARALLTELQERFPHHRPIARNNLLAGLTDED